MAVATDLVQGTIVLSGDLQGNENGNGPELTPTGVTAGTYFIPDFVVGPDGRMLDINNVTGPLPTDGLSFASQVPDATTGSKGLVQIGSGLTITAGEINVDTFNVSDATTISKGYVQIGDGIDVVNGEISTAAAIETATTSSKGFMQVGDNLIASGGILSIDVADSSDFGVVRSADTSNITISTGDINIGPNVGKINSNNTWENAKIASLSTISYLASMTPDFSLSNVFELTLAGNATLNAPSNAVAGGMYTLIVKQDAIGSRTLNFGSEYTFHTTPTITSTALAVDVIFITCVSTSEFICVHTTNYS